MTIGPSLDDFGKIEPSNDADDTYSERTAVRMVFPRVAGCIPFTWQRQPGCAVLIDVVAANPAEACRYQDGYDRSKATRGEGRSLHFVADRGVLCLPPPVSRCSVVAFVPSTEPVGVLGVLDVVFFRSTAVE